MTPDDIGRAAERFGPHQGLAASLLPHLDDTGDGAHDVGHLIRVWKTAEMILAAEGGDPTILAAAVVLHDCVAVEKHSPARASASRLAAARASGILDGLGWTADDIAAVAHAISAHSFSAAIAAETIEAKILQDADRLDAIGMIGVARCFYIAGRMGSGLYDPFDPAAVSRPLDDRAYALDHFPAKLLRLADGFNTPSGRAMAATRHQRIASFLDVISSEI